MAAVVAVGLSACAGSGYRYVKSAEANTYFKVPEDWRLFDEDAILRFSGEELSPQQLEVSKRSQWLAAFDAHPRPSLEHVFAVPAEHPVGIARVRAVAPSERDTVSLTSLRSEFFGDPVAAQRQGDPRVEIVRNEDVVRPGGLHGNHIVVNLRLAGGLTTVNQTTLVDDETRLIYLFLVGCEAKCYSQNEKVIDDVVESWTVKER